MLRASSRLPNLLLLQVIENVASSITAKADYTHTDLPDIWCNFKSAFAGIRQSGLLSSIVTVSLGHDSIWNLGTVLPNAGGALNLPVKSVGIGRFVVTA